MASYWRHDGFAGRYLEVDLSTGALKEKSLDRETLRQCIGGKGLATHLLTTLDSTDDEAYDLRHPVTGDADPAMHPTTPVLIMTGPFQGSKVGSSGRAVVCSRSPLTNIFIDTYIGGDFAHDLRLAGWDGLFIHGRSENMVRLQIEDQDVSLQDAENLRGKTTWQTEKAIAAKTEVQDVFSIGPAGEALVRISSPITAGRRAAGRGGTGAQFGNKNLKAISVLASGESKVANDTQYLGALKKQRQEMGERRKVGDPFYRFGTSRAPIYASEMGRMPTLNYTSTTGSVIHAAKKIGQLDTVALSGEYWHESLPEAKQSGCCRPCPIACEASDRSSGVRGKPLHVLRSERPEYETLAMIGANLGIDSSLDVMDGNDACNRFGVDTISSGAALSLICELALKGWFPDDWSEGTLSSGDPWGFDAEVPCFSAPSSKGRFTKGEMVPWGYGIPELPPLALERLSNASPGDGSLFGTLASGAVACSRWVEKETGHPATRLTAHCKGLDLPAWDPRGKRGNGMAYMTCNVGASHMRAGYKNPTGIPDSSALDLMPELIHSQNESVIRDSMILCAFASGATPDDVLVQAYNGITGDSATIEELHSRASAQWDSARLWNIQHWERLGVEVREQDVLSYRLRNDALPDGPAKGMVSFVDDADEADCLTEYYRLRGWNDDGRPHSS